MAKEEDMKKWYEKLKEGDEVLVFEQFSSSPNVEKFCGFFNGNPVISNTVFMLSEAGVLYAKGETAYPVTEEYLLKAEHDDLLGRISKLRLWDDCSAYTNEDFKKLIAFHEEIISRDDKKTDG